MLPTLVVLAGATASGKSAFAEEFARRCSGEIVNADAFQIYRGLPILTAQPSPGSEIPHHLYGALDPREESNAARFLALVTPVLEEIRARGKLPILCGGTGLYLKAVTHGLDPLPPSDPALRAELSTQPLPQLVEELARVDPASAATVDLQNPRRVVRALEIFRQTGQPASELRQSWGKPPPSGTLGFVLQRPRAELHDRIARRTQEMFQRGVIEEVRALPELSDTASRALGWREIWALIRGQITQAECERRIVEQTRQYAKRQETWFRKEVWMRGIESDACEIVPRLLG